MCEYTKTEKGHRIRENSRKPVDRARYKTSIARTMRRWSLKTKYGLSPFDYQQMVEAQGALCPICGKKKELCVDHDHRTGKVRGLLCATCNSGLGFYEKYAEKYRAYLGGAR